MPALGGRKCMLQPSIMVRKINLLKKDARGRKWQTEMDMRHNGNTNEEALNSSYREQERGPQGVLMLPESWTMKEVSQQIEERGDMSK